MRERGYAAVGAVAALVACYLVMVASSLAAQPWVFAAASATSYLLDAALLPRDGYVARLLSRNQLGLSFRFLVRELLLVVLVLTTARPVGWLVALLLGSIVVLHVARAAYTHLVREVRLLSEPPLRWRNLDVPGIGLEPREFVSPAPAAVFGGDGARAVLHLDVLVLVGVVLSIGLGLDGALTAVFIVLVLAAPALPWAAWRRLCDVRRDGPSTEQMRVEVLAAVERLGPEVMLYFSNPNSASYALNVWLPIVERFRRPTVLVLREVAHLDQMMSTTTPIVVLPKDADVECFPTSTIQAALYPTNVIKNNAMLNRQGLLHAFINHGDSDKVSSYNPVCRVFDEIWVAGEAGRERYLAAGEGIRDTQIHVVGRPQLAEITRVDAPDFLHGEPVLTVLYAPTWEGFFDESDYSSLEYMGVRLLRMLLESQTPVRLLFKAHPATGSRRAAAGDALRAAERLVRSAPGGHRVVDPGPDSLYAAFNEADVLVSDVSSVITDFLASHKPYIVTNPKAWDRNAFHSAYPATGGGYLLDPDCARLDAYLHDITGEDGLRPRREQLAVHLLGDDGQDPVDRFLNAVDDVIDRGHALVPWHEVPGGSPSGAMFAEPAQDVASSTGDAELAAEGHETAPPEEGTWLEPDDAAIQERVEQDPPEGTATAMNLAGPLGLALCLLGMAGAATASSGWVFSVFVGVGYLFDSHLARSQPEFSRLLSRAGVGVNFRALLRHTLLVTLLLRADVVPTSTVALLLVALLALHVGRALTTAMLFVGVRRRSFPVDWRNLEVDGVDLPGTLPAFLRTDVTRKMMRLDVPAVLAVVIVAEGGPPTAVMVGVLATLVGTSWFVGAAAQQLVVLRRAPDAETVVQKVLDTVTSRRPAVAVYFSGTDADTHLLNSWTPVVEQLDHQCLVVVRERLHLDVLATTSLPVLFLRRGADVETFHLPSLRLALYPSTRGKNNHMLRLTGIKDVLIGSGSDTHRQVSRVYDEIWVEDDVAREQFRRAGIGVRPEQVRAVGRPRLANLRLSEPAERRGVATVLYAPAAEGADGANLDSSLSTMGSRIVSALLETSPPVRILFRPQPATGSWRPSLLATIAEIESMMQNSGGTHRVVPRVEAAYLALTQADLVITDLSSLVTDCLYVDKPFFVTNPRALTADEMRREHPTSEGGYLLSPDCSHLPELLADALGSDPLRARRGEVAVALLGERPGDPARGFRAAVEDLLRDVTPSGAGVVLPPPRQRHRDT